MVRFSDIVWNPTDEKVIKSFCCKRRCNKLPSKMSISCPFVICDGDLSSNWFSTDSWSCVPWNFFNWRFFFLVLSAGISFLGCCALLNTYLFSVLKLLLSELGRSSSVDCLIVGINYFDTGLELDCVLAWFGRNVDEMRGFFLWVRFLLYLVVIEVDMFQWKQKLSGCYIYQVVHSWSSSNLVCLCLPEFHFLVVGDCLIHAYF